MPLLNYDRNNGEFRFTRPLASLPFPGARVSAERNGRTYSFDDVSPTNYRMLKQYQSFYKDDAKVTREAARRIRDIKENATHLYVDDYRHLITGIPYSHQLATINLMQQNDRYALLLEQGLGKTYIAIQSFRMFKERDGFLRAVVVCPKVVFATWVHEFEKFAPEMKVLKYRGNLAQLRELYDELKDFEVLLTTYDMIRPRADRTMEAYNGWAWDGMPMECRNAIVAKLPYDDRRKKILLSDEETMDRAARTRWRNACGKLLDPIGHGWWNDRPFMSYSDTPKWRTEMYDMPERVMMCRAVQEEGTYDDAPKFINRIVKPNVVVFDEASRLVNHASKQSRAAEEIECRRKYLLSGTLCVGRPTDMFMPMKILDPAIIDMNWTNFRDKFCYTSRYNRNIITGYRNLDLLKSKVDPYIIEYRRDECLDLPDRTLVTCYYEPDPAAVKLYDEIVTAPDYVSLDENTQVFCSMQLQKIQKCMQTLSGFVNISNEYSMCRYCSEDVIVDCAMTGVRPGGSGCSREGERDDLALGEITRPIVDSAHNAKLQMLKNDLEDILQNEKAIIWYWYNYDHDRIVELLESMKIEYVQASEDDCARRFEESGDIRVFLGQIMQGIGITLNSATTTIYYSHGLALEPRLQSMDRNMRIGQSKPVVVRDYVCRGSVEESIVSLLQHKEDVKDFMQKRVECLCCDEMLRCVNERVRRYGEGCIYRENMKKAEEKRVLKLRTIGGLYR